MNFDPSFNVRLFFDEFKTKISTKIADHKPYHKIILVETISIL